MKEKNRGIFVGGLIILIGVLLLLRSLDVFYMDEDFLWGAVLFAIGLMLVAVHQQENKKWWALVFGCILCLIGVIIILNSIRAVPDDVIGTVFLWAFAAAFVAIYWVKNENWWAIIPGGVLFVLGAIVLLNAFRLVRDESLWFVFFFGVGLVFWFLYLIRDEKTKLDWARFPGGVLIIFSFFLLSVTTDSFVVELLFPISLIVCGGYMVYKNLRTKPEVVTETEETIKPQK